jgi:succinate dehydrogenase / fumarate reductase membrane anchor subunit
MVKKSPNLGSAKHGTEHWWQQRVTAIALVLVSTYVVTTFFTSVDFGGYVDAIDWLTSPFSVTLVILFLIVGFYHAVLGLQVVIEDYVHSEGLKLFSILAVKFIAAAFAILGILSTVKILFWSLLPHVPPPS